jgi:hypothetical protein
MEPCGYSKCKERKIRNVRASPFICSKKVLYVQETYGKLDEPGRFPTFWSYDDDDDDDDNDDVDCTT